MRNVNDYYELETRREGILIDTKVYTFIFNAIKDKVETEEYNPVTVHLIYYRWDDATEEYTRIELDSKQVAGAVRLATQP